MYYPVHPTPSANPHGFSTDTAFASHCFSFFSVLVSDVRKAEDPAGSFPAVGVELVLQRQ